DRGIAGVIPQAHWEAICARMQRAFAAREFEAGTLAGIAQIGELLTAHFPAGARNADELPNRPVQL
ncbi:MAG TPA: hypothetical protein VFI62_07200, partial [Burkholderiales bacterium]|nr:hypothetical protein [Burkholderiales bacterium]